MPAYESGQFPGQTLLPLGKLGHAPHYHLPPSGYGPASAGPAYSSPPGLGASGGGYAQSSCELAASLPLRSRNLSSPGATMSAVTAASVAAAGLRFPAYPQGRVEEAEEEEEAAEAALSTGGCPGEMGEAALPRRSGESAVHSYAELSPGLGPIDFLGLAGSPSRQLCLLQTPIAYPPTAHLPLPGHSGPHTPCAPAGQPHLHQSHQHPLSLAASSASSSSAISGPLGALTPSLGTTPPLSTASSCPSPGSISAPDSASTAGGGHSSRPALSADAKAPTTPGLSPSPGQLGLSETAAPLNASLSATTLSGSGLPAHPSVGQSLSHALPGSVSFPTRLAALQAQQQKQQHLIPTAQAAHLPPVGGVVGSSVAASSSSSASSAEISLEPGDASVDSNERHDELMLLDESEGSIDGVDCMEGAECIGDAGLVSSRLETCPVETSAFVSAASVCSNSSKRRLLVETGFSAGSCSDLEVDDEEDEEEQESEMDEGGKMSLVVRDTLSRRCLGGRQDSLSLGVKLESVESCLRSGNGVIGGLTDSNSLELESRHSTCSPMQTPPPLSPAASGPGRSSPSSTLSQTSSSPVSRPVGSPGLLLSLKVTGTLSDLRAVPGPDCLMPPDRLETNGQLSGIRISRPGETECRSTTAAQAN
ncbi:unnamed protein product [Protopolystoma xenopodis]|uniref:Uncharacterized protein n=1 Tax=Protopolystoma xenopodis TaxID=117903 RepID=A0A3S5BS21_9PLAT|nr:unnamed protein product [Protopolystoma xenopodis]